MSQPASVSEVTAWLKRNGSAAAAAKLSRYGLPTTNAYGISVGALRSYANKLGKNHRLALAVWKTGSLDARILAAFLGEHQQLTLAQMNAWCREFDNWGTTDTACFALFDQSPLAWKVVGPWTRHNGEFQRRAGFVMMACLAAHDKTATDAAFLKFFPLIEKGASDERNFVKKGVSWALRHIGHRNARLHAEAVKTARTLAASDDPTSRWIGKDALRDLTRATVVQKVAKKR